MPGLTLSANGWQAEVRPDVGGCIASLTFEGVEVLRTMPAGSSDVLGASCFPLTPFCNRVANAAFRWDGGEVRLPRNFPPEPHNLHGDGWQSAWEVTQEAGFKCGLRHHYAPQGEAAEWPWAYEAEQRIRLGTKGCAISLNLTNLANTPMPAGPGLHPYFRRRPETLVSFASSGILASGSDLIPTGRILSADHFGDFAGGDELPEQLVDHCFSGWNRSAVIRDDLGSITLTARGAPYLHLYAPPHEPILCLEPVSHAPDALNQKTSGMTILPPGCTASMQMWISAER